MAEEKDTKERNGKKKQKKSIRSEVINFSLLVISILIGLSVLSFSPADDARSEIGFFDTFRLLIGDETIRAKAATINNWLGLFGAYIAHFFVNYTLGYFSIAFPIVLFIFSWTALLNKDYRNAARISTMVLLYAAAVAILSGYLKTLIGSDRFGTQWYGLIGLQAATGLTRAFGAVGGGGVIFILVFALVVYTLKISPRELIDALGSAAAWAGESIKGMFASTRNGKERPVKAARPAAEKQNRSKVEAAPVKIVREDAKPKQDAGLIEEAKDLVKRVMTKPELKEDEEVEEERLEPEEEKEEEDARPAPARKAAAAVPAREISDTENVDEEIEYTKPSVDLLDVPVEVDKVSDEELRSNADLLRSKLEVFGIQIESVSVIPGPVVTLYELVPAEGVKISRITSLADDLALALQARGIRIIAPIPGKGAVGVEIPNRKPQIVKFKSIVSSPKFKDMRFSLPIAMGKTTTGEIVVDDLSKMPHRSGRVSCGSRCGMQPGTLCERGSLP